MPEVLQYLGGHGRDDWGRTDEFRCAEASDRV